MSTPPSDVEPLKNWDKIREEWVSSLDTLFHEAEAWAEAQEWATRRDPEWLEEEKLGRYEVWRLLVHASEGRVVFTPIEREARGGAIGLVDLFALPSYDPGTVLVRHADRQWRLHSFQDMDRSLPWAAESFVETMKRMFAESKRR